MVIATQMVFGGDNLWRIVVKSNYWQENQKVNADQTERKL